jgi:hypothetical protein
MRRAVEKKGKTAAGVSTRTLIALAPVLQTRPEWLLTGQGDETDAARREVRIIGYVGAHSTAHYYAVDDTELDRVPAPEGWTPETVAVEIRGESLGALFNQWLVYYDEVRSPITSDMLGRLCVVGLLDERVVVKTIRKGSKAGFYNLLSNTGEDDIKDAEVAWAAKVKNMTPR